jgi:glycerol-3-phosphate dehydrogenase
MDDRIQSGMQRALRPPLENLSFHVIVIGGGINGVAIARECARRGHRTLLVEQNDFGSGTTSRSTRIIHGGLRYLEHGDLAQVRESLRERAALLRQHPNLVKPMQFLLARDERSSRSALTIRTGLWLYRKFGGASLGTANGSEEKDKLEHLLDSGRKMSVFSFEDAQCEFPERLVAEWLVEATNAGCVARNYSQVLSVEIHGGRATGIRLRDRFNGKEEVVQGTWIVNASGPWVDQVCQDTGVRTGRPMVGGVRGSHIVLPRFPGAPGAAIYTEAVDGRPIFVVPWNDQLLVGTTEIPDSGNPDTAQPTGKEIEYLVASLRKLFPAIEFALGDIHYAFAGVRPLPFSPESAPSAVTRRHFFHDHGDEGARHFISIIGGKLTTAAALAREFVEQVIGHPADGAVSLPMAEEKHAGALLEEWVGRIAKESGISESSAEKIAELFGARAAKIAGIASQRPELRARLCPHSPHIVAEAIYAFAEEQAATLADVLLRRVPVALGPCWSGECAMEAANRIGAGMGWREQATREQLEAFHIERDRFLKKATTLK